MFPPLWLGHLRTSLRAVLQEHILLLFQRSPSSTVNTWKPRDKWRPRGLLHSEGQVSYWTGNTKHISSQNTVWSMFKEMCNWKYLLCSKCLKICKSVPYPVYRCTVPSPGVDQSRSQSQSQTYVGTPQGGPREESQQVDRLRRRQDEASSGWCIARIGRRQDEASPG